MAKNEIRLREAYDHLVKINRDTFSVGEFNVTYHALMAAMHCAGTLRDIEGLSEVERLAREELAWIDSHHPEYEHSTESASKRGRPSVFSMLARQANTKIQIVKNDLSQGEREYDKDNH